jgi:aminopeptidase N
MEQVGCVTYNEVYLFRGRALTLRRKSVFTITNLHELAHMWFGNLVTMQWWNDLWLNESFATFMAFLAMSKSQPLQQFHDTCWVGFMEDKGWGISADQLGSTHPICCEIAHTGEAESIFDGISYGKGAAWLKQLYYILGHETMSKGLAVYFQKHEWGNTTLPDFVKCLEDAYR